MPNDAPNGSLSLLDLVQELARRRRGVRLRDRETLIGIVREEQSIRTLMLLMGLNATLAWDESLRVYRFQAVI